MTPYIPNCAAPLVFENDLEEAPYGMAGTGFLLRSNSSFYFLTAKHALTLGDHDKLRVPRSFDSPELLELVQFGHPTFPDGMEDTDWLDIAAFSVVPIEFGKGGDRNALEPAYLSNGDTRHLLQDAVILTVRGFPKAAPESRIDFERKRISMQALECDAKFLGLTKSLGCYQLQFIATCPIDDFNYMSGSPVFAKLLHQRKAHYVLVGILLRAGGPERLGRFVSIEVFKRCRNYYADPTAPPPDANSSDGVPL